MVAALGEDRLDAFLLAEGFVATNELDLRPGVGRELLGMLTQLIAQRLGPPRKVEQPHLLLGEIPRHGIGVTDLRQRPCDHHTVEAGDHGGNVGEVLSYERVHGDDLF